LSIDATGKIASLACLAIRETTSPMLPCRLPQSNRRDQDSGAVRTVVHMTAFDPKRTKVAILWAAPARGTCPTFSIYSLDLQQLYQKEPDNSDG